ncbi:type IV secretory pathway VirB10-like protein [Microvirga lupini]|uniref:Type IV secretory pathway VirB10-like protein n=1 Tax=Microvirga lupini TaxID=420324 RepID=A0A7W4YVZ2_9HYPH|nr:hypothetical protein [Microvirga lupini]MBB3017704.1 type IV secretory pathway VirB10-like protein [Microvirga lupini]
MPRVICDLPFASDLINGVAFHPLDQGGKISDDIETELAEWFATIPGYKLDEEGTEPEAPVVTPPPKLTKAQQKAADKAAAQKAAEEAAAKAKPEAPATTETAATESQAETQSEGDTQTETQSETETETEATASEEGSQDAVF